MREIAEFIAVLACALFSGAAVYISFVEHPARMECGTEIAIAEFRPSYRRATFLQASLAALGLLSSAAAWLTGAPVWWLTGGLLLGSVIPFTLIAILPTNKQLMSESPSLEPAEAMKLLTRWARLHAVRGVLSVLALLLFVYLLVCVKS
jgi:uncharacterized membrane protein